MIKPEILNCYGTADMLKTDPFTAQSKRNRASVMVSHDFLINGIEQRRSVLLANHLKLDCEICNISL